MSAACLNHGYCVGIFGMLCQTHFYADPHSMGDEVTITSAIFSFHKTSGQPVKAVSGSIFMSANLGHKNMLQFKSEKR